MKTEMHKDIQPTQDHWKTYKQKIQTHEKTMRDITKNSTGYQITESLYKKFQPHFKKFNLVPISKPDAVTIATTTTTTTLVPSPEKPDAITKYNVDVISKSLTALLGNHDEKTDQVLDN